MGKELSSQVSNYSDRPLYSRLDFCCFEYRKMYYIYVDCLLYILWSEFAMEGVSPGVIRLLVFEVGILM